MKRQSPSPSLQLGLGLIELMIAMTIGLVIVSGIGYIYVGNSQSFRTQESLTTIQENARYALETMSRDIRMAGYSGCGNLSAITPHVISDDLNGAVFSSSTAAQVYPNGAGWAAPAGLTVTLKPNTDVLRINEASGGGVPLTGNMLADNDNIQITGNPYNFQPGDVLMVSNCEHADVFTANNVSSAGGKVTIAHSSSVNSNPDGKGGTFLSTAYGAKPPPAFVFFFTQSDYFIGCPTASYTAASTSCSVPWALYRIPNNGIAEPLVSNVENMKFLLGVDTSGTTPPAGVVGAYQTPTTVANANGGAGNWANVLTVQVHLLMVGAAAKDSNSVVNATKQHYTFLNGTAVQSYTAGDNRMYQDATATVAIRNRI